MSEIIDLEEFEEDVDYESIYRDTRERNDTDSSADSMLDPKTGQQPRLITIKSYTEICIEAGDSTTEEPSPRTKPKFKSGSKSKESAEQSKATDMTSESKQKDSRPKTKFPKSKEQVNVWGKQKKERMKRKVKVPCWFATFIYCCGVSKEHQWYSLLGKGVFLVFFMLIIYLVVSLTVLPFLVMAAVVGSVFLCAGVVSYLALASKKVGVSFDEDGDATCLRTVWGSWV